MDNKNKWEIYGDKLTIKINEPISAKDISEMLNSVVDYERKHVSDYHTKYSYWNVETNIDENNISK